MLAGHNSLGSIRELRLRDCDVTLRDAADVTAFDFDAAVIGSAIYAMRWRGEVVRLLKRLARKDTRVPVWLFHSGPLSRAARKESPRRLSGA